MNILELDRLISIEKKIKEIAEEFGLLTTEITFEVVPAKRMLECMAYMFPVNFSHWSFGRDYDKYRTIYEHTGAGIPYEQVWNFERPRALIVETNPFALNVLTIAHVYGHVDYFLGNRHLQYGRSFADIAEEARGSAERFAEYEVKYGKEIIEKTIDACMSIQWQQHPDPLFEEELDNEFIRDKVIALEREKIRYAKQDNLTKKETKEEVEKIENNLKRLLRKNPPQPVYDLLGYIMRYSAILQPFQRDILSIIRNQARALAPNRHTKMLDEGWATYWHLRIMRRLFEEGLLTDEEHGIFNDFHSKVTRDQKLGFNWYRIGSALFEYIKDAWDRGAFGDDYEDCEDPVKKAYWNKGINKGTEKIFEVRSNYSDRMGIEDFFTDEFIKQMKLYIYEEYQNESSGEIIYYISENRPEVIRNILKQSFALYGIQSIVIENSDYNDRGELYLVHKYYGLSLEPRYRDGTLEYMHYLWGKDVHLSSFLDNKQVIFSFDGKIHKVIKEK